MVDLTTAAVIGIAFFIGSVVKGVTGMGMPLVAIPILSLSMAVRDATPMIVLPALATNIFQVTEARRARLSFSEILPILFGLIIGAFFGVRLAISIDPDLLLAILGAIIISFVILSLLKFAPKAPERGRGPMGFAAGTFTGVIGGMTGGFGPVLAIYLLSLHWPKDTFVWAMGVLMLVSATSLGLFYAGFGAFAEWVLYASLGACVPAFAGIWVGSRVRKHVAPETFRSIVMLILAIIAIKHIATAFGVL